MERLSHIIDEAVAAGDWKPVSISAGGPLISHLFYADDLILFAEASENQARVIRRCLDRFCAASGQGVSREKSVIFCSKNTNRHVSSLISLLLGIPLTQNLGRYLGVPILHERINGHTYQDILDRIDMKLAGWKAKSLSLAGRVTLAQSVLAAIPAYAMQTSILPATTCEEIDRRIRNFVWGTTAEERKIPLVAWDKICMPKENGGLGLRQARQLNRAYITKLAFTFFKDKDRLWVQILQHKYFKNSASDGLEPRKLPSCSPIWKGITREWGTMLEGGRSAIRDGKETRFWTTCWVDAGLKLIDFVDPSMQGFDPESSVADFTSVEGTWNFGLLETLLPPEAVDIIAGMTPPKEGSGDDDWVWGCEKSGVFTIKSAYDLIGKIENPIDADRWKSVWKWRGPSRVRFFLWLAAKGRLLTNAARHKRGLSQDATCPRCAAITEDSCHVLRDCPVAAETWRQTARFDVTGAVWQGPYGEWLTFFLNSDASLLFGIVCHNLWKARNESIFANKRVEPPAVAIRSRRWQEMVERAMARDEIIQGNHMLKRRAEISWVAGPAGWITLNSDGSVQGQQGKAAAGGLLRDNNGTCVLAYTMNLGTCSITRAEIRGALEGIRRAWDAGYRRLEVQIDSQAVVALLSVTSSRITHSHALEVLEFQEWMTRDWEVKISHVYREANHAADHIASRGHSVSRGSHLVDPTDSNLAYFIRYDCMGISETRMIN
ncbi:Putative ribonuclease H protein At1g65750 [Linum perenne]